jgi:hypothetical protein
VIQLCVKYSSGIFRNWNGIYTDIILTNKVIQLPCKVQFRYIFPLNSTLFSVHIYKIHQFCSSTVDCFMPGKVFRTVTVLEYVCVYVHMVLQNGLQISCAKVCFIVWYWGGSEVTQIIYLVCIVCGMWSGKSTFL